MREKAWNQSHFFFTAGIRAWTKVENDKIFLQDNNFVSMYLNWMNYIEFIKFSSWIFALFVMVLTFQKPLLAYAWVM